jgi:hypothetical protein
VVVIICGKIPDANPFMLALERNGRDGRISKISGTPIDSPNDIKSSERS